VLLGKRGVRSGIILTGYAEKKRSDEVRKDETHFELSGDGKERDRKWCVRRGGGIFETANLRREYPDHPFSPPPRRRKT